MASNQHQDLMHVQILQREDVGTFWAKEVPVSGNVSEVAQAFLSLEDEMTAYFTDENLPRIVPKDTELNTGLVCAGLRKKGKRWVRLRVACVMQTTRGLSASCFLLDYAATELIGRHQLRTLPEQFRRLPYQACCYRLHGIQPVTLVTNMLEQTTTLEPCNTWDTSAKELLNKFLKEATERQLEVVGEADEAGIIPAKLYLHLPDLKRVCVNDYLAQNQYAAYTTTKEQDGLDRETLKHLKLTSEEPSSSTPNGIHQYHSDGEEHRQLHRKYDNRASHLRAAKSRPMQSSSTTPRSWLGGDSQAASYVQSDTESLPNRKPSTTLHHVVLEQYLSDTSDGRSVAHRLPHNFKEQTMRSVAQNKHPVILSNSEQFVDATPPQESIPELEDVSLAEKIVSPSPSPPNKSSAGRGVSSILAKLATKTLTPNKLQPTSPGKSQLVKGPDQAGRGMLSSPNGTKTAGSSIQTGCSFRLTQDGAGSLERNPLTSPKQVGRGMSPLQSGRGMSPSPDKLITVSSSTQPGHSSIVTPDRPARSPPKLLLPTPSSHGRGSPGRGSPGKGSPGRGSPGKGSPGRGISSLSKEELARRKEQIQSPQAQTKAANVHDISNTNIPVHGRGIGRAAVLDVLEMLPKKKKVPTATLR